MDKIKILIFPSGSEIAFEIFNALKYSKFVELYGANSVTSHAEYLFRNCVYNIPFENEFNFIEELNLLVDKWKIDFIYPAHDSACFTLSLRQKELHAKVVTSPFETIRICRSKKNTYEFFKEEFFVPRVYNDVNEIEHFPVFAKPSIGQGSVGAQKINCFDELSNINLLDKDYTICEYLPGDEYTVDCFTDKNRLLRVCHPRIRERIKTGISVRSRLVPLDDEINSIAEIINNKLDFCGAWFFQVKKNEYGHYRLLEISPRIPGTMGTSRNLGINYPLLTIYNLLGLDIDIIDNGLEITSDRAFISRYKLNLNYNKVYVDFDDTICINGEVNILLIAFLYQCINKKIPIILLTKHNKDIKKSLDRMKISRDLFSEIVSLKKDEDKSKYVDSDSIFIDDSFSERLKVKKQKNIPVFDLDMIESLIDWRL